jgi:hypothetical protein
MQILINILIAYGVVSMIFTTFFFIGLIRNIRKEIDIAKDIGAAKQTLKLVYVEHVDGMYRMHDKFTHHFICQAKTELELWNIAHAKFPDKTVTTLKEDERAKDL